MKIYHHAYKNGKEPVPDPTRVRAGKKSWRTRTKRERKEKLHLIGTVTFLVIFVGVMLIPQTDLAYFQPRLSSTSTSTGVLAHAESPVPWIDYEYVARWARAYNLNPILVYEIVECESGLNPLAESTVDPNSHGLVQINLDAHPHVSLEQAQDPDFSMEFMMRNLEKGRWWMWKNCYEAHI